MTTYRLPYRHAFLDVDLRGRRRGDTPSSPAARGRPPRRADPVAAVEAALEDRPLPVYRGGGCAIAINDRTRPVPHDFLLPPLLRRLQRAGVAPRDIRLLIATGTHACGAARPATPTSSRLPILDRYRVASHDAHDARGLVHLGETSRGTPIWINREVCCGGDAGGGRRDRAAPVRGILRRRQERGRRPRGLHDHRPPPFDDDPPALADRPVRGQSVPAGHRGDWVRIGVHLALNVMLGERKRIIRALAGPPLEVMRRRSVGSPPEPGGGRAPLRPGDRVAGRPSERHQPLPGAESPRARGARRPARAAPSCWPRPARGDGQRGVRGWMRQRTDLARGGHPAVHAGGLSDRPAQGVPDLARRVAVLRAVPLDHAGRPGGAIAADAHARRPAGRRGSRDRLAPGSRIGIMPLANATIPVVAPVEMCRCSPGCGAKAPAVPLPARIGTDRLGV